MLSTKKTFFFLLCAILFNAIGIAQGSTPSPELKKIIKKNTLVPEDTVLDDSVYDYENRTFKTYKIDGSLATIDDLNGIYRNGNTIDYYWDKNKVVQVAVLRELSTIEKEELAQAIAKYQASQIKVGDIAPQFEAIDINDNAINSTELRGKIVVLNFWFVKCAPCVEEMPELNELVKEYKNREDVVFISVGRDSKEDILSFFKSHEFIYQPITNPDAMKMVIAYNINAFPNNMIIDKNGNVAYTLAGGGEFTTRMLADSLKNLINQ